MVDKCREGDNVTLTDGMVIRFQIQENAFSIVLKLRAITPSGTSENHIDIHQGSRYGIVTSDMLEDSLFEIGETLYVNLPDIP